MAHAVFDGDLYWAPVDGLDGRVDSQVQLRLYGRVIGLMKHVTTWLIHYKWGRRPVAEAVARYREAIAELEACCRRYCRAVIGRNGIRPWRA